MSHFKAPSCVVCFALSCAVIAWRQSPRAAEPSDGPWNHNVQFVESNARGELSEERLLVERAGVASLFRDDLGRTLAAFQ